MMFKGVNQVCRGKTEKKPVKQLFTIQVIYNLSIDLIEKLVHTINMDIYAALAEPNRRAILEMLAKNGPLSATEIYDQFPISHPAISQHLKVLREAKLVHMEKRAQQHIYQINAEAMFELEIWASHLRQLWDQRYDALDAVLEVETQKIAKKGNYSDYSPPLS